MTFTNCSAEVLKMQSKTVSGIKNSVYIQLMLIVYVSIFKNWFTGKNFFIILKSVHLLCFHGHCQACTEKKFELPRVLSSQMRPNKVMSAFVSVLIL